MPDLSSADVKRTDAARHDVLTRAMDDRMFAMQRQGKMSFYMKSRRAKKPVSVGHAHALRDSGHGRSRPIASRAS